MNSQWYTNDQSTATDLLPPGEPPERPWIARWWPGVVAVVVVITVVALLALLLPGGDDTTGAKVSEMADVRGSTTSILESDTETGERVIKGTEAPVGGGRDTRLIAGHVTVLVPNTSVSREGTLEVHRARQPEAPDGLEHVAEAVEVDLVGTTQTAPITMEVALPADTGPMSFQATETEGGTCCQLEPGKWDVERNVLVSEVEGVSLESFFSLPLEDMQDLTEGLIRDRFSPQPSPVGSPQCQNEDDPQTDRWSVVSEGDDSIRWCLERLDSGGRELRVRNTNRHAVMLSYPEGFPSIRLEIPFALSSLLTNTSEFLAPAGKRMVVLQRGDVAKIDVSSIPDGYNGTLTASSNVLGWTGDFFDVALDVVLAAYDRLPRWAKSTEISLLADRAEALESLDRMPCVAEAASGEELTAESPLVVANVAGKLVSCMQDWLADYGPTDWSLSALYSVAGIPGATINDFISGGSIALDETGHSITVNRLTPEPAPTPKPPEPTVSPTTARRTNPASSCPDVALGRWSGTWSSNGTGSGTLDATLETTRPAISGTIAVEGTSYVPGGALTGSVECTRISFGQVDQLVEFTGQLAADGRSMSGSYRSLRSGAVVDRGTFTASAR